MAELPLLIFPSSTPASRTQRGGFSGSLKLPSIERQGERLLPVFEQLQNSFNARNIELQQTSSGIDPEQTLVIETVGNVEGFASAVKKIPGLEWMGESVLDGVISPDDDFQDKKDPEKDLDGRLYLIMSNQTGLKQMLSLWQRYIESPETINFRSGKYRGLAKFKDVFRHLKDLRRWGVKDRLAEGEVFEIWKGDALRIKVNCRKDAQKIDNPIAYELIVSLEVAEGVDLPIYNEILTRIAPESRIQP